MDDTSLLEKRVRKAKINTYTDILPTTMTL